MTEVLDGVAHDTVDTVEVGRPRRDAGEPRLVDHALADRLLAQAQDQGVELLGEGGLLSQMTKAILERSLAVELTHELGYEQGDPAGAAAATAATARLASGSRPRPGTSIWTSLATATAASSRRRSARANGAWTASTSS